MSRIRLLVADVDGTLVTPEKELTERTQQAARELREAGVALAITSSRPPRGMRMLVAPLGLSAPIAAFNGGMLVEPDLTLIEEHCLPPQVVGEVVDTILRHGLDVWVYRGTDWLVRSLEAPHVARELRAVGFSPTLVPSFEGAHQGAVKIVGVSDAASAVSRCEDEVRVRFGDHVSASRSQPYYLDVTHPLANKGAVVKRLSELLEVETDAIATIGDMANDVLMFAHSGLGIAMGNASLEVRRAARRVTSSNEEEGFANAVERYVLPNA